MPWWIISIWTIVRVATISPSDRQVYFLHDDRLCTPQVATDSPQVVGLRSLNKLSLAGSARPVPLVLAASAATTLRRAAAGKIDQAVYKSAAGHAVNRNGHPANVSPGIREGIVHVVIRIDRS